MSRWLLPLCVLLSSQGCTTDKLWNEWGKPDPPELSLSSPDVPLEVMKAVRAGDGSHHLIVRMSDATRYYVIDAPGRAPEGDAAPIGSHQWPDTLADGAALPAPRPIAWGAPHTRLPLGLPLRVATPQMTWWREHPTPDPTMAVVVDAPVDATPDDPDDSDEPMIGLDDRRVVLKDPDGRVTVLAEFPPPPAPRVVPAPRSRPVACFVETSARVVLTPFTFSLDVAACAVAVTGGALLLPFFPAYLLVFGL